MEMAKNKVTDQLKKLPISELDRLFHKGGMPNFIEFAIENVGQVIENTLKEYNVKREGSAISKVALTIIEDENQNIEWDRKENVERGVELFLQEYLAEVNWTKSQLQVGNGKLQTVYLASNILYQTLENKKLLARPVVLPQLIHEFYYHKRLKGYTGYLVTNLAGRVPGRQSWSVEQHLEQEMVRASFLKSKPEGRVLYGKKVMSKDQYEEYTNHYSNPEGLIPYVYDEDSINYIAYLTQVFGYRNTNILAEKTQTFLQVLAQQDQREFNQLKGDEFFRRTRIYEKDGYTLILRSRFVLIDSIRNQVIINKTPTNMAKKDIELIVRLITSK